MKCEVDSGSVKQSRSSPRLGSVGVTAASRHDLRVTIHTVLGLDDEKGATL